MKGIPIKFRAKLRSTGEYVYSTQVRQYKKDLTQGYIDSEEVYNICQLVGYDAAGEELYEGDKVNCYHGFFIPAEELKKKKVEKVSRVELVAMVRNCGYEDLNAPFDYQFLTKGR